jgi:hypothetical protein
MGRFTTTTAMQTMMVGTVFDTTTIALATQCLSNAENVVSKWVCKKYDISAAVYPTITAFPPDLATLSLDLAVGFMYENMSRGSKEGYARADRYIKRTMTFLNDLVEDNCQLTDSSGIPIEQIPGDWKVQSNTDGYSHTFNEDDPKQWVVSQNKLTDIESERDE